MSRTSFKSGYSSEYILWETSQKKILPRPEKPQSYPEKDERHWYDYEYPGWGMDKINIPESTGDGAHGKHIILINGQIPHPYFIEFTANMANIARTYGIELEVHYAYWDIKQEARLVDKAISEAPDIIILIAACMEKSTELYKKINKAGIPVIASNTIPQGEGFKYIIAWAGPDDWGQARMLAGFFAEKMDFKGGYCIVEHFPGTSPYYARTWGTITELEKIAPRMRLLGRQSVGLDIERTRQMIAKWITRFGDRLKGIICADDCAPVCIHQLMEQNSLEDVICVAFGNTKKGMELLREGKLHAITYQSPKVDGALSLQLAIDWFNGLQVDPISYLPKHIIVKDDVEDFIFDGHHMNEIDLDSLYQEICDCSRKGVHDFFSKAYQSFVSAKLIPIESFRGFCIEVLSNMVGIIRSRNLKLEEIIGSYETIFKNLFKQKTIENTFDWLEKISEEIINGLCCKRTRPKSQGQRILEYIEEHYSEPMSLKMLSYKFNFSAAYLGRLFRQESGKNFTRYLNELRVEKSKDLLRTTSLKANEIARRIGYTDPNYFYDIFKRYTGMSPTEFIKRKVPGFDKSL